MIKLVAILLVVPALAHADSKTAKAESLFRQGRELLASGKIADACNAFDASQKLDPATTTLFNQADCREKNGQLATAWGLFVEGERETRAATDDVGMKLHSVANERATALEARVSKLTITVPADPGITIFKNGVVLDPAEWNQSLPVDGGTYTVIAKQGDREVFTGTATVNPERDVQAIVVHTDKALPAASPVPEPHASHTSAIIATVTSVALLGGALGFELWGESTDSQAIAANDQSLLDSANTERYIGEGLLVGGLAVGAYATYLWLRTPDKIEKTPVLAPTVSSRFAGLQFQGHF